MSTLQIFCLCKANTHTFAAPSSSLPLTTYLCSCNISRRISGSLLTSYVNITHGSKASKPDTSECTAYHSSDILKRWFCSTCGTHLYLEYKHDGHFEAATGVLSWTSSESHDLEEDGIKEAERQVKKRTDGLIDFKGLMWIDDTKDGGASIWLDAINGRILEKWSHESGQSTLLPNFPQNLPNQKSSADQFAKPIHAHCHCNGVEFWITPPSASSRTSDSTKSPFPDLQIPHHLNKSANPGNENWWLVSQGKKYLAGTCTCTTCRQASGFDITFWAFIPTLNIFLDAGCTVPFPLTSPSPCSSSSEQGSTWPPSHYWGSMKAYNSSPGVTRTFCGACGANVFFVGEEERVGRKGLLDVAVGLLDAESGARAEEGLGWWTERVSFVEEVAHAELGGALEMGLKRWDNGGRGLGDGI